MNGFRPARAMVLAAGRGRRMRPLTDRVPKPLVRVGGRTLLDRVLDSLLHAGVETAVVNVHWLAERIERSLAGRAAPRIVVSRETEPLETGGGIANALGLLGGDAFFAANADILWSDGPVPALERLAAAWRDADMDALLLVHPAGTASGYDGPGDFRMEASGRLARRGGDDRAPLVFLGLQILHPRLFDGAPDGVFPLGTLYRRAEDAGRLFGIAHDGAWHHVGTPAAVAEAEAWLERVSPKENA